MKSFLPIIVLALGSALCQAQTPNPSADPSASQPSPATSPAATAAAPQPSRTPPPAVSSVTHKTPPTQPEMRNGKWEARALANTASALAQSASIDVVFDGDSITDFWQRAGLKVWTTAFANYHPFDFGISGDTTQNLLWRLAHGQAAGLHPKVILLMIGTNDMKYTSSPEDIAGGVGEIIRQYRTICPDAVIILQAIFPRGPLPTDPYRLKVNATNALLAKLGDGSKVIYLDFGAKFLGSDGTLSKDIMPDFLHPTEKGYQIWADAVSPLLKKYVPASTPASSPK